MKSVKRFLAVICVLVIMFANSITAFGVGFDVETTYNSVFVIYSGNSLGSGFAIGENCIITNAHVIDNENSVRVTAYNGEEYDAYIVALDQDLDIAVLGVEETSFIPLQTADLSQVNVGDDVYAIGAPNNLSYSLTKGVVSAKERIIGRQSYIQTDTAINSGNSGGPLLNDAGEVIGVNSYKMSDSEGIGLSIPIQIILDFIGGKSIELDEHGNVFGTVQHPFSNEQNNKQDKDNTFVSEEPVRGSLIIYVLAIGLGLSLLLNILLTILLVFQKKKNVYSSIEPSERTDFDIDILE